VAIFCRHGGADEKCTNLRIASMNVNEVIAKVVNDMNARFFGLTFLTIGLAGCAQEAPPPSTGFMPPDAFGYSVIGEDPAMATFGAALDAFIHPGMMQNRPAQMALGVASLDAMAGQFSTNGRWMTMDPIAKAQMLQARDRVREILGIPETAPSQAVINQLVTASKALNAGDQPAAMAALTGGVFTRPAAQNLALLTHFPYVPIADQATMNANQDLLPMGGRDDRP
jgi:hypothetical protein